MTNDRENKPPSDKTLPWWAEDAPRDSSLPEGFPERPDLKKVHDMRDRMRKERASRKAMGRNRLTARFDDKTGRQLRDMGSYTLIPMLMLAGPAVGYGLGWLVEKQWDIKPWGMVIGVLLGLAAGFQQIILLLKKTSDKK
jgi:F0F1-type ATP synthase assembly protein I|nr:AtpZ/AtpI family protein [Candidatus Krumholzibacteria bacterium]